MNAITWALLAAAIWGFVPLLEKWGLGKVEPWVGIFYRCLGVTVSFIILSFFVIKGKLLKSVDIRSALFLVLGGILASVVAQVCFYVSLKQGEMSRVVPIAASYPLISFILGILLLGESFNLVKLGGVSLILLGIWALKIG